MTKNVKIGKAQPYHAPASDSSSGGDSHAGAGEEESHDMHEAHEDQSAHGGHGPDTSDEPTIVPTNWKQLIFPLIILIFVAILVAGPVMGAFGPKPATPQTTGEQSTGAQTGTPAPGQESLTPGLPTNSVPQPVATQPAGTPSPSSSNSKNLPLSATQTAVAAAGEKGDVARAPVRLEFGGVSFAVATGSGLLPDWESSQDGATATWIEGTVANHILYVPFNTQNEGLFKTAKENDIVKLTMNTGDVFSFVVTRSQRAVNGPPSGEGQFTVNAAMAQDHAGVTLFLTGDPASDRAVVQADFTGNIQSAVP